MTILPALTLIRMHRGEFDTIVGIEINGAAIDLVAGSDINITGGPGPSQVTVTMIVGSVDIATVDKDDDPDPPKPKRCKAIGPLSARRCMEVEGHRSGHRYT